MALTPEQIAAVTASTDRPRIVDAGPADAAVIADIYNESIAAGDSTMDEEPMSTERQRALIAALAPPMGFVLLVAGEHALGWGVLKPISDRHGYRFAAEVSVFLRRSLRRRGYGGRLVEDLVARAADGGLHHLVAKIQADNAPSIALFEKLGFGLVGVQREVGFKAGRWVDVAILQRVLRD